MFRGIRMFFFQELKKMGVTDDILVIILADHGESLGEHDFYFEHGAYTYDVNLKIPCLIRFPSKHPYSKYSGKKIKGRSHRHERRTGQIGFHCVHRV